MYFCCYYTAWKPGRWKRHDYSSGGILNVGLQENFDDTLYIQKFQTLGHLKRVGKGKEILNTIKITISGSHDERRKDVVLRIIIQGKL